MSVVRRSSSRLLTPLTRRPVISGSALIRQRWASSDAKASSKHEASTETKQSNPDDDEDLFFLPFEWDLEYLAKFPVPAVTAEQLAKSIPAPEVDEVTGRAGKLASELFEIATGYGVLPQVEEYCKELRQYFKDQPDVLEWIADRSHTKMEVRQFFEDLFQTAVPVLKRFGAQMVENNDLGRLPLVVNMFDELVRAHKKEILVVLDVAKIPAPERLERLKAQVAFYFLPKNSIPLWEIHEKPELVAGYTLNTKLRSVDMSQAGRDATVKDTMQKILTTAAADQPTPKYKPKTLVINTGEEFQNTAQHLKELPARNKAIEGKHYRENFVDWV